MVEGEMTRQVAFPFSQDYVCEWSKIIGVSDYTALSARLPSGMQAMLA